MYFGKRLALKMGKALCRSISGSRAHKASQLTISSVMPFGGAVSTVDHNMSVEWAAQLMAERHIEAIPVTKDDRVIGLFTERDYFEKVLNERHQATQSSMVSEVGTMGPELIIARPDDSVEDCLTVMTSKNLMAMPVVEHDGHVVGTVSVLDLTRPYMEAQKAQMEEESHMERTLGPQFSEPADFPDGFAFADDDMRNGEMDNPDLFVQSTTTGQVDHELGKRVAEIFCEGSVFPEYTPTEEMLLAKTHGEPPSHDAWLPDLEREERLAAAHAELLSHMDMFCEASDFPETAPVDEAVQLRGA